MDNGLIARRYAKALYKFALEHSKTADVYKEMTAVAKAFADNPALQRTLSNPYIAPADKEMLMRDAAGSLYDDDFKALVQLVIQHHREEYMQRICLAYCDIYREENKISLVRIVTAKPLSTERMDRIHSLVGKVFPDRTFEYTAEVNPDLIGGFQVYVDNVKMDASISNELQQLRQNLISSN